MQKETFQIVDLEFFEKNQYFSHFLLVKFFSYIMQAPDNKFLR